MLTEGERWTRAELARLRENGWRPRAWVTFVRAAQIRTNLTRHRRPALARQAAAWMLMGAAAWLIAARRLVGSPFARARGRGLIWWGACAVMLDWHLGMLETPEGRTARLGAADALTLARAWLVPAVAERAEPALLLLAYFAGGRAPTPRSGAADGPPRRSVSPAWWRAASGIAGSPTGCS